jgi:hypothetical protein
MSQSESPAATSMNATPKMARVPKGYGAVEVRSDSFNEDDRTVEIIWAAGASVKRYSWDEGFYMEELSMDPKHIRLGRFAAGMSLLDTHDSRSMASRLGTVIPGSVRVEGGKAYATIKLSRKPLAEELMQDLRDGHPFPVSVGYRTHAYEKREGDDKSLPVLRAIDWEPLELSAVPVPADGGASSRSEPNDEPAGCEIISTSIRPAARNVDREGYITALSRAAGLHEFGERHVTAGTSIEQFEAELLALRKPQRPLGDAALRERAFQMARAGVRHLTP